MTGKTIDQIHVGDSAEFAKTISESDIYLYAGVTGDFNPAHINEAYAQKTFFKTRIAHGLLGLAVVEGLKQRIPAFADVRYMASLYWNYKFTGPILIGDTIRVRVKIASKRETKKPDRGIVVEYVTMLNQRGEIVQEGEHGLMALRKTSV